MRSNFSRLTVFGLLLLALTAAHPLRAGEPGMEGMENPSAATAYDYAFTGIDGAPLPLDQFKGKVILIVNIASDSRFVDQLAGLEVLYEAFKDRGFVVIGVPSNDFGEQEPLSEGEIERLLSTKYHVTFPLTEKTPVFGEEAHPFYRWAADQTAVSFIDRMPLWNFHKLLIGRNGQLIDGFLPFTAPDSQDMVNTIDTALAMQQ